MNPTGYSPGLNRVQSATQQGTVEAKERLEGRWGEPLFLADWAEPVFLHFAINPKHLQGFVPFPLDTREGKAYITLVAFTMRNMRFRIGGKLTRWMTKPIATHSFLNLRTYVKVGNEAGIHFICEWLNSRLASCLGPNTFGLPYRFGELSYDHDFPGRSYSGSVRCGDNEICYRAGSERNRCWCPCERGSLDDFLLERYTAFTARGKLRGLFRVWHEPWPQQKLKDVEIKSIGLLKDARGGEKWVDHLRFVGGNASPGATDVWMGRPHLI